MVLRFVVQVRWVLIKELLKEAWIDLDATPLDEIQRLRDLSDCPHVAGSVLQRLFLWLLFRHDRLRYDWLGHDWFGGRFGLHGSRRGRNHDWLCILSCWIGLRFTFGRRWLRRLGQLYLNCDKVIE